MGKISETNPNGWGRKTSITPKIIKLALEYVSDDPKKNYIRYDHAIPSIVGLCRVLKRSRSTIYLWATDPDNAFSDIVDTNKEFQELVTLNGTLNGTLNANIGKLVLGKHGYHDRQVVDTTVTLSDLSDEELTARIKSLTSDVEKT